MRGKTDERELVVLAALLVFVAGLCLQPITESDLFFRLKVGQEILARRGLLGRNLFSFTAPEHPDLDLSWAFEVAVALLYRAGGFPAVVIGKTVGIVVVFAGAFAVCRRRGAGAIATAVALASAAWVMRERLVERPHVVSFAGEVLILAAVTRLSRPWSGRALLGFAFAMALWANAHAGVFAGGLILGLAALGALPNDRSHARRALVLGVVLVVAACAIPVGPVGLVRYLVLHLRLPALHPIDEFRGATWRSDAPFFVWVAVVVAVVAAGRIVSRQRRSRNDTDSAGARPAATLPELLPALGMTLLGLASVRFSADAALCTAPLLATELSLVVAARLGRAVDVGVVAGAFGGGGARGTVGLRLARAATPIVTGALLAATLWPRVGEARAGRPIFDLDVDRAALPLGALHFVESNGLRERMYNDFEFGSYLLFEGYPRHKVFVDPRLPAYPEDMHRLLGSFDHDRATWGAAMNHYGVETALLGYAGINRRVAWWDSEEWALVYREADARVFVRRRENRRALIATYEIPATFDFTVENGAITRPLETKPARSPVPDCEWQRRLGDLLFDLDRGDPRRARLNHERALAVRGCLPAAEEARLAAWLGAIELHARDWERAAAHLGRALDLAPGDTRSRANRATVFERLDRRAEAVADWARVADEEGRGTPLGEAASARARDLGL